MLTSLLAATTAWAASPMPTQRLCARATCSSAVMSVEAAARAAWLARTAPEWSPPEGFVGSGNVVVGSVVPTTGAPTAAPEQSSIEFQHAARSFFAEHRLAPKGSRRSQGGLVDVGEPHDFSRPLAKDGEGKVAKWSGASAGSWACTSGGWDSPKLRPTTEVFLVLDGQGCVTDADGVAHPFGPGDVVVLPKRWYGRWDITQHIHKIWVVHDHPDVEIDGVVRAVVAPVPQTAPAAMAPVIDGALYEAPAHTAQSIYSVGPTRVGFLSCTTGSFVVSERTTAEFFFVVDGEFFLTNLDGSARRCVAGDTVVLPKGWAGRWDIIEPVTKVWTQVFD